jgi:hypothetical protein
MIGNEEKKGCCFQEHCKSIQAWIYINRTDFKCSACEKWFDFDPHMDVHIGDFVGVHAPKTAQKKWQVVLGGEGQRASKCGKRRRRVLGSMVLANQTKRPP